MFEFVASIFAMGAPVGDPKVGGAAAGQGSMSSMLILLGMFVLFYFVLIFPETRRRKKLQEKIKGLRQGDKVVTSGGIVGIVDFVSENEKSVHIKSAKDTKIEIHKDFIVTVLDDSEGGNK